MGVVSGEWAKYLLWSTCAFGGQGMIPWTPGCECSEPSYLRFVTFADGLRRWKTIGSPWFIHTF